MSLPHRTRVVGVVNVTEDSFSDGGRYLAVDDAIAHAFRLRAEGADLVELGAAASHPEAVPVPPRVERRRLGPVLDALQDGGVPVAVDTCQPETQVFAAGRDVDMVNDIRGFPDPGVRAELAAARCQLVVMHSVQRGPATRVATDPAAVWRGIRAFFAERLPELETVGVARDRLVVDPGLGYFLGSRPAPSLLVLGRIAELRSRLALPVLVSASRKSFVRAVVGRDVADSGPASLAAELYAAAQGVDYIRTHDVAALRDALAVREALSGASRT